MSYCKSCGHQLSNDAQFCGECGWKLQNEEGDKQFVPQQQHSIHEPAKVSKPMNPKTKKWMIIGVILVFILLGTYKLGENLTSRERIIDKLETALIEKDKEKLASILTSTDKKLKIDAKSLDGLFTYLEENPDQTQYIVNELKAQSHYLEIAEEKANNTVQEAFVEGEMPEGIFNLKQNGKSFLVYDKYEISVTPVYLTLYTNYQDTSLYVDGKKVANANEPDFEKTVGPFLPGIHKVEAKLKTDFIDLTKNDSVLLWNENKEGADLYLEGENVTLYSNLGEEASDIKSKVMINNKEVNVNAFDEPSFGPVLTDGSMSIQVIADLPWGETKTAKLPIEEDSVEFNLGQDESLQQTIMDTLVLNAQEWMKAYTTGDPSKMSTDTKGELEVLTDLIDEKKGSSEAYKGEYLGTTFDLNSFSFYRQGEQWKISVDVREFYNSDYYYSDSEKPELEEDSADWTYYLVYDEQQNKWLVDSNEQSWGIGEENLKEYKEEKPKMYTSSWGQKKE